MNKNLSIHLDLLRFIAAVGVLTGHASEYCHRAFGWWLGGHSQSAVAIFFVLSGFVIRFVTVTKESSAGTYMRARMVRLYSVVIVTIVVTFIADSIGYRHDSAYYLARTHYNAQTGVANIFRYLTFSTELWLSHRIVGSNEPFWSLGFEVPYYLLYGLFFYLRGGCRWLALPLAALVIGPKIILYMPLWLAGVVLYDIVASGGLAGRAGWSTGLLLGISIVLYAVYSKLFGSGTVNAYHFDSLHQVVISAAWFYGIGLVAFLHIGAAAMAYPERVVWPAGITRVVRWSSGTTFTIYLAHYPILLCLFALFPQARTSPAAALGVAGATLVACFLLAEIGERRKKLYARIYDFIGQSLSHRQRMMQPAVDRNGVS